MAHEMEKFTLIAPWSFKCIITHSLIIHWSERPSPSFSIQMSPINLSMLECSFCHPPEKEVTLLQREITVTCCVFVDEKGVRNGLFTIPVDIYHGS